MLVKPLHSISCWWSLCPRGTLQPRPPLSCHPVLSLPGSPLPARPQKPVSGHPGHFLPRGPPPSSDPSSPVQARPRPVAGKRGSRSRLFTLAQRQGGGVTWGPPHSHPGMPASWVASCGHRWVGRGHSSGLTLPSPPGMGPPASGGGSRAMGQPSSAPGRWVTVLKCGLWVTLQPCSPQRVLCGTCLGPNGHLTLCAAGHPRVLLPPPRPVTGPKSASQDRLHSFVIQNPRVWL